MGLVLLVRHGQASFGADDYDVLSETGVEQSLVLGRALAAQEVRPDAVVHGAMRRQRETAVALVEGAGWSVTPQRDDGWNEFDHLGVVARRLGGLPRPTDPGEFQRIFREATDRWSGGDHDEEYDETWASFVGRVRAALERACARAGVTLVVTSGGPIAVAVASLVDPSATVGELPRLWNAFNTVTVNAAVTRVVVGSTGGRLLTFNEHAHLARDQVTYR